MSNYASDAEEYLSAQEADPAGGYDDPPTPDEYEDDYWWQQRIESYRVPEVSAHSTEHVTGPEKFQEGSSGSNVRERTGSPADQAGRSTDDDG